MSKEEFSIVKTALIQIIVKLSTKKTTRKAELALLPLVVDSLVNLITKC